MIVKFLSNKGGGSAAAVMDYMLGKDGDREGALLLSGDPDLTERIADNLDFKNRYTVGVLSFEEANLESSQKQAIMQSFENTLLAGLERDQYDITWIEHIDKGRLELNFVIPNVELSTGKRLQPYFDQADRPLVENWKQVTNFEYGLSDPHAPDKAQAIKVLNSQNLPESVREIKAQIGVAIAEQISQGSIQNRQDVIKTLENAGFEIARQTDRSISIKNPDGKRNIRLEGTIYENRQFDQQFAEEHRRAGQDYQGTGRERYQTALGKLQRLTDSKQQANREHFTNKPTAHRKPAVEDQRRFAFEYTQGSSSGQSSPTLFDISGRQRVVGLPDQAQNPATRPTQPSNRPNSTGETGIERSGFTPERGQENLFHRGQEHQKSGSLYDHGQRQDTQNRKITSKFDHSFNKNFGDGELLQRTELLQHTQLLRQPQPTMRKEPQPLQESDYDKRLYESIQRHLELVRAAIERAKRNKSASERADRSLEQSESSIENAERAIDRSQHNIKYTQRGIEASKQQVDERVKAVQGGRKSQDKGFFR